MRDFLKGLELDSETIDSIMAEHGKQITKLKESINSLKDEVHDLKDKNSQYEETIKKNDDALKNLETLTNENKNLKAEIQMSGSEVKKEFSKFVMSEVMSKVDDKTDFETALGDYKKENPQYFGETVVKKVQSSPSVGTGENHQTTADDIMNNLLRGK